MKSHKYTGVYSYHEENANGPETVACGVIPDRQALVP